MTIFASASDATTSSWRTLVNGTSSVSFDGSASARVAPAQTERVLQGPAVQDVSIHEDQEEEHDHGDEEGDRTVLQTALTTMNHSTVDIPSDKEAQEKYGADKLSPSYDTEKTLTETLRKDAARVHKQSPRDVGSAETLQDNSIGANGNDGQGAAEAGKPTSDTQGPELLSTRRFLPLFIGFILTVFLISLDTTVVATAQVQIATDLDGSALIAWLPTTFLIGQASFSLIFGQLLAFFSSKYVFLSAIFLFELGSLVSGVAPNMGAMLAGRTVSGVGAAGLFMSCMQILAETTTVAARAQYMGILGAILAISMVAGPLIGGAITDNVTWRWVFYINLPIGGAAAAAVFLLFPRRLPLGTSKTNRPNIFQRLAHLDIVGLLLFSGLVCMLVIPVQEAHTNGWTTAKTWAPIACAFPVAILCGVWCMYMGEDRALIPIRLFRDANFVGCALLSFLTFWASITFTYLIPLFYQTVRGDTPTQSGVDMLALMITLALVSLFTGATAKISGQYYPQLLVGPLFGVAGAALMYQQKVNSSTAFEIGTQILLGVGTGAVVQMPILTVQANIVDRKLLATATSFIVFMQRLGGGLGSSVSGAIVAAQFQTQIRDYLPASSNLAQYAQLTPEKVYYLPAGPDRDALLRALTHTITFVYVGGVPVFSLMLLIILFMVRIKNIKTQKVTHKVDLFRKVFCLPARRRVTSAGDQS